MTDVDTFVEHQMAPEQRALAATVRAAMRLWAPQLTEEIAYGIPMWKGHRHVAWLSPSRRGLSVGFTYGVGFADPHGQLRGRAKNARHVLLRSAADVHLDALRDLIWQAVAEDERRYGPA